MSEAPNIPDLNVFDLCSIELHQRGSMILL